MTSTAPRRRSPRRINAGTTRSPDWRCCSWPAGARWLPAPRSAPLSPISPWRWDGLVCFPQRSRSRSRHTTWRRHGKLPRSCARSPMTTARHHGARPRARRWERSSPTRGSPKRRSPSCARRSGSGPSPTCRSRPRRPACGSPPRTAPVATRPRPCWSYGRLTRSSSSSARPSTRSAATRRSRRRSPRPAVASGARSCSPTSWGRRTCSRRSATRHGKTSCAGTTRRSNR